MITNGKADPLNKISEYNSKIKGSFIKVKPNFEMVGEPVIVDLY